MYSDDGIEFIDDGVLTCDEDISGDSSGESSNDLSEAEDQHLTNNDITEFVVPDDARQLSQKVRGSSYVYERASDDETASILSCNDEESEEEVYGSIDLCGDENVVLDCTLEKNKACYEKHARNNSDRSEHDQNSSCPASSIMDPENHQANDVSTFNSCRDF